MADTTNHQDEIIRLKKQKPFKPFVIEMKDGDHYEVNDRFSLAFTAENPTMALLDPKRGICQINKDEITAVRVIEPAI